MSGAGNHSPPTACVWVPLTESKASTTVAIQEKGPAKEFNNFSLLGFWHQRATRTRSVETGKVALIAWLYHRIDATSCQAGRNVSSLHTSMSPQKIERISYKEVVDGQRVDREKCAAQVEKVEGNLVGQEV